MKAGGCIKKSSEFILHNSSLDMAQEEDIAKARLLQDYGADINPIDDEYQSTPLGWLHAGDSGRWLAFCSGGELIRTRPAPPGRRQSRAKTKGHDEIAADLTRAGAVTDG